MNRSHSANSGFAPRSPFAGSIARTRAASAASAPEKPVGIVSAHPDHPVPDPDRKRKQRRKFRLFSIPRTRTTTPLTPGGGGRDHSLVSEKSQLKNIQQSAKIPRVQNVHFKLFQISKYLERNWLYEAVRQCCYFLVTYQIKNIPSSPPDSSPDAAGMTSFTYTPAVQQ